MCHLGVIILVKILIKAQIKINLRSVSFNEDI